MRTNENKNHAAVVRMVTLALLAALVIVLQTVASNIKVGPIPITLTLVPIVIGAVLRAGCGRTAGRDLRACHGGRRPDGLRRRYTGADSGKPDMDDPDLLRQGDGCRMGGRAGLPRAAEEADAWLRSGRDERSGRKHRHFPAGDDDGAAFLA